MTLKNAMDFEGHINNVSAVKGGGLFASIDLITDVSMNKKSRVTGDTNPYIDRMKKITLVHGDCLVSPTEYEKFVNNRRIKEGKAGDFKSEKPSGRHHIDTSSCITQSDKKENQYYMSLYFLKNKSRIETSYTLDGKEIDINKYANYLSPSFFTPKVEGEKQGLDKPIVIRTPKVESITRVKCGDYHFSS